MKYLILILLLSSCYTKNQAIKKFCSKDTVNVVVTIHDTIRTETIRTDTIFNDTIDSVFITKDKLEIVYVKKFGKIYIEGKCKEDTFIYYKKIFVKVPVDYPKLSWYKQLGADYWYILPLIILIYFLIAYFHKIMNNG